MRTAKGVGLLVGVLTLIYGVYLRIIFSYMVLATLNMIVYLFLGVLMLLGRRQFFVVTVFWTIFGVALATFTPFFSDAVLNLLSFLIVFSSTFYYVTVTKADVAVAKRLGLWAGILALAQGIYVALAILFAYIFRFPGWIIPVPPLSRAILAPSPSVAALTAAVYTVAGIGMRKKTQDSFVLLILWILLESALAVADSSFTRSHFNIISILILAFATYHYFEKTKNR